MCVCVLVLQVLTRLEMYGACGFGGREAARILVTRVYRAMTVTTLCAWSRKWIACQGWFRNFLPETLKLESPGASERQRSSSLQKFQGFIFCKPKGALPPSMPLAGIQGEGWQQVFWCLERKGKA